MRKIPVAVLLFAAGLRAQTADVAYFRAILSPANEVPQVNVNGKGAVDIIAHVVRDSSGQITSGSVEFITHITLPTDPNNDSTFLRYSAASPLTQLGEEGQPAGVPPR